MKRIGRVAAVGSRIGQWADETHELGDRARIAVGDHQGQSARLGRTDMQEVDRLSVDRGGELGELVERGLVRTPVVVGAPVFGEPVKVSERHTPAPVPSEKVVWPAGPRKPVSQVVDIRLWNIDPERPDLGVGAFGIGHRALSPFSSARLG